MKKIILFFALSGLMSLTILAQKIHIKTGIEVLKASNFKVLEGKRVGLITNATGVDNHLKSTVDILSEAPNVKLVALYAPEHGVRGDIYAGDKVEDTKDSKTGIPVYSLYGRKRELFAGMMKGIDVLVYDIQDIGCRSYTFISTMGQAMQTAAENDIEFVVLDRPNPLGGEKVEGNLAEDGYFSNVSRYRVPYLYGLTCGELAQMINNERSLGNTKPCKLTVVKMKGWKRKMTFDNTGLQWLPTSPQIPQSLTAPFYAASGIVGETAYMSIGVGYTLPFQIFAAPWINAQDYSKRMNSLNLPGVTFTPIYLKPYFGPYKEQKIQGVQVFLTDYKKVTLTEIQFLAVQEAFAMYPEHKLFGDEFQNRFDMIDKVCGTNQIRELFGKRYRWEDAKAYWDKDVTTFKHLSKKYYLYK
ncbi:MAG: exo-beta-N-acetylmuramidase NamZ family protein [Paludibacteraceae bacterium]